jgi:hypothetical protein
MSKRFVDTERRRKELRGVDPKIRLACAWLWENCDAAGVWSIDHDLFKFECGYKLDIETLLKTCGWIKTLPNGSLFLLDFVPVNYGVLKPGYNPHKPVFRSLEANGIEPLTLKFQDLPNPYRRVEEEGEEEDTTQGKKERASEVDERFESLWRIYEGKGAKGKAREYWAKLTEEDRAAILAKAPDYVAANSGEALTYRKNLEGWINPAERRWEAPIILRKVEAPKPKAWTKAEAIEEVRRIRDLHGKDFQTHHVPKDVLQAYRQTA